jgi:hypothetical protein
LELLGILLIGVALWMFGKETRTFPGMSDDHQLNEPTEAEKAFIAGYLAVNKRMDIDRLRASHVELLAAAKNAAAYLNGGAGTRWKQTPILNALQAAIAKAEEPAP